VNPPRRIIFSSSSFEQLEKSECVIYAICTTISTFTQLTVRIIRFYIFTKFSLALICSTLWIQLHFELHKYSLGTGIENCHFEVSHGYFNKQPKLVTKIFHWVTKHGRQRDKFISAHGTLRVKNELSSILKRRLIFSNKFCFRDRN